MQWLFYLIHMDSQKLKVALAKLGIVAQPNGLYRLRDLVLAADKGEFDPKLINDAKFKKADYKVSGFLNVWQLELKASRNKFSAEILEINQDDVPYHDQHLWKGNPFRWAVQIKGALANSSNAMDLDHYAFDKFKALKIPSKGYAKTFDEAEEACKAAMLGFDEVYFYRKDEFYPYG